MKNRILRSVGAFGFAALLGVWGSASAIPTLYLDDGAGNTILYVQGVGVTLGGGATATCADVAGGVTCIGVMGVWNVNVSTGLSSSPIPDVDLNSVNHSTGAGFLNIRFGDVDFNIGSATSLLFTNLMGGTTAGQVTWQSGINVDNTNVSPGGAAQLSPVYGPAGPGAFSSTDSFVFTGIDGPFGLGLGVIITHSGAGTTSFDYNGRAPEPGTLVLLGIGLLGAAAIRRRKLS